MRTSVIHVLFLSRENAARSLLAEACLRHLGADKFKTFSAGMPGEIAKSPSPWCLLALQTAGIPSSGLACKDWTEFSRKNGTKMDFVISLDAQTHKHHPAWPGQPETALWAYAPLVAGGGKSADASIAMIQTLHSLRRRIELLVSLRLKGHKRSDLRDDLRDMAFV